jgi:protein transport protein SEC23
MGGPITFGPGMIVSDNMKELIRSHIDIQNNKENVKYMKPAMEFFQKMADRAQKSGIVMDTFVASVDQVGVLEMKPCLEQTGGFYIMTDSFGNPVFKESFKKFFEVDENSDLRMGFLAYIKCLVSKELQVSGAVGQVTSCKQSN